MRKSIFYYQEVSSTNDLAKDLAKKGSEEGTMVIAERQTKGRGRFGRTWFSPEGGIYLSLILRPQVNPKVIPLITLLAGVAVAEAIKALYALSVMLKWPNDVLINGKKVSGILTEMESGIEAINFVIVGIGINANIETRRWFKELDYPATSLMEELGKRIEIKKLINEVQAKIENFYFLFKQGNYSPILEAYRNLDATFEKIVEIKTTKEVIKGKAMGIDNYGSLKLKLLTGEKTKVCCGEVISNRLNEGKSQGFET
ncbi:MAG: biotin--[acetyl-CoA-carboxylase] ligase [Candidatus Margulisiibacteriota bacterium]